MIHVLDSCDFVRNKKKFLQLRQVLKALDDSQTIEGDVKHLKIDEAIQIFDLCDLQNKSDAILSLRKLTLASIEAKYIFFEISEIGWTLSEHKNYLIVV